MRAIVIDSKNRDVREVDIPKGQTLEGIQKEIGTDIITIATVLENDDSIFVDDEGLFKDPQYFFHYDGGSQPFAGNGVIMSANQEGDTIPASSTLEEIKQNVKFLTKEEIVEGIYKKHSTKEIF